MNRVLFCASVCAITHAFMYVVLFEWEVEVIGLVCTVVVISSGSGKISNNSSSECDTTKYEYI